MAEAAIMQKKFKDLKLSNKLSLFTSARKGLKPKVFYDLAQSIHMPEKELASLINLSARTVSNYKQREKLLEPVQSEHLLKLIGLYQTGESIFGSIEAFNLWLSKPFWNTDEFPKEWLVTPGGVDLVHTELEKLAEGYPV